MKISTVLREAANTNLWDGMNYQLRKSDPMYSEKDCAAIQGKSQYSCDAFHHFNMHHITYEFQKEIEDFLYELGLNPETINAFTEFEPGEERQSVRYAWLMFAADIAEEEGN
jgi:hypothetical protein